MNAWKERKRDKTNLHKDQLGTVRAITDAAGVHSKQSVYKPFGTVTDWQLTPGTTPETKGFIGERYDADAGLQYLNARNYDPELGCPSSKFLVPKAA